MLKQQFWKRYLTWAETRLMSIFQFLDELPSEKKPDVIVFPEFAIPFELLWIPAKYTASTIEDAEGKNHWVVVAGNHAYTKNKAAYASVFNQKEIGGESTDTDAGSPGSDAVAQDSRPSEDGFQLPEGEDPKSESAANSLLVIVASPRCVPGASAQAEAKIDGEPEVRSSLANACRCDTKKSGRIVFARFKTKLSPYEFTSLHRERRTETIDHTDVQKWIYKFRTVRREDPGSEDDYSINVFICAEALQGVVTHSDAHVGVVCAYHTRPEDFSRFVEPSVRTRHLVVVASDGAFGKSRIAMNSDRRMPDWTREEPFSGIFPTGDIIQISELPINPVGTVDGSTNPFKSDNLLLLAGIIPGSDARLVVFYKSLRKILKSGKFPDWRSPFTEKDIEEIRANQDGISQKLLALLARFDVPPVLDLKVRALARYANAGQLSLPVLEAFAHDCITSSAHNGEIIGPDESVRCGSLRGLEKDLAAKTYAWLRHRSESGSLSKEAAAVAIDAQRKCLLKFRGTATLGPIPAVKRLHLELTKQVKRRTYSNINSLLGIMVERFAASSGWVFLHKLKEEEVVPEDEADESSVIGSWPGELEEMVSHNVPLSSSKLVLKVPSLRSNRLEDLLKCEKLESAGICAMAVALGRAIVVGDLESSPYKYFYARKLATTRSVIAVPIYDAHSSVIKGCLILESDEDYGFVVPHVGELQAEASKLLPELLIAESVEDPRFAGCWHPELHGWDLGTILREFSDEIATSLHEVATVQSLSCTVWHADWDKGAMYVRSAARFNFEYIAERIMPLSKKIKVPKRSWIFDKESFTGKVASGRRGQVHRTLISEIVDFNRSKKARRMGVAYLVSCPIYSPEGAAEGDSPIGVLNLYFFRRQHPRFEFSIDGLFPDHDVGVLTDFFGHLIWSTKRLRQATARATLTAKLDSEGLPGVDLVKTLREVGKEVLGADTISIFAGEPSPDKTNSDEEGHVRLRTLSSTGLMVEGKEAHPETPYPGKFTITKSKEDPDFTVVHGITAYLACNPSSIIRKTDVQDLWEVGALSPPNARLGDAVLFQAQNVTRDSFEPTEIDHRRFLGASIGLSNGACGVMRATRASGGRPFVRTDGELLHSLLESFGPHFVHSRVDRARDLLEKYLDQPDYGKSKWNRRFAESLFQHYLVRLINDKALKECGIVFESAYIRVRTGSGTSPEELRMLYGQST